MSDDFDWSELEDSAIIQKSVQAVAVYTNPEGDIVIRQAGDMLHDDDSFVVIPKEKAAALIAQIQACSEE